MVEHASVTVGSRRRPLSLTLSPAVATTALVAANFLIRVEAVLGRDVQRYLPDEYLYGQLARSIAGGNGARVLGEPVALPTLLQPLLTAPAWLFDDPEVAFRLTQCANAAAMSIGAILAYVLARELGIRPWIAVGVTGVTLASPGLLYSGYVTADAFGYALAMLAILVGVRAIARPSLGLQAAFIATAALATFARAQYTTLFVAAVLASFIVERGRVRAVVSRHLPLLAAPVLAACAVSVAGQLGRYASTTSFQLAWGTIGWLPPSVFLLSLAAGAVVVPGAVAWTLHELALPQDRPLLTYAALTTSLMGALLLASALVSSETGSDRFFERYLIIGAPLAAIAFGCWISGARPWRLVAVGTTIALVVAVARVPLSGFTAGQGRADSPFLLAVGQLETTVGVGEASLLVAVAVSACALLAFAAMFDRVGTRTMFSVAIAVLALASVGAHVADRSLSRDVREAKLGGTPGWVDRTKVSNVLLAQTAGGDQVGAMLLTLHNTSVNRAALLGRDATPFDGVARRLVISRIGILRLGGQPVRGPIVVVETATRVVMHDADVLGREGDMVLLRPRHNAEVATIVRGLYRDGWLGGSGVVTVFGTGSPTTCRRTTLKLSLPPGASPARLKLREGGALRQVVVRAGYPTIVAVQTGVATRRVRFDAEAPRIVSDPTLRSLSVRARLTTITRRCTSA